MWDTAGQERFRTITQSYYRSAHGAILAYDLTRRSTFESIPHWIHEIEKYGAANLVMMLIGRNLILNIMLRSFFNMYIKSPLAFPPLVKASINYALKNNAVLIKGHQKVYHFGLSLKNEESHSLVLTGPSPLQTVKPFYLFLSCWNNATSLLLV